MGNCLQINGGVVGGGCAASGGKGLVQLQGRTRRRDGDEEEELEEEGTTSVLKVKMVLTKAELEWLMAQLKSGGRRLGDVLREMARNREARGAIGWRPSLESIVECPETMGAVSFD